MTTVSSSSFGLEDFFKNNSSCPGKDLTSWSWLNNSSCERSDRTERSPCEHQPCPAGDSPLLIQINLPTLKDPKQSSSEVSLFEHRKSVHILVLLVILLVCL